MTLGDEKDVVVEPGEGYGEYDADLFEEVPVSAFPKDITLNKGMGFRMHAASGKAVVAYVERIGEDHVVMNLNHPLAGQTLHFNVRIADLREATAEDMAGGCASCAGCGSGCASEEDSCGCEDTGCCH